MMRPEDIAAIAAEMAALGVARMELTGPDYALSLARAAASSDPARAAAGDADEAEAEILPVAAPGLGAFLRKHPLHQKPLAVEGEAVASGQAIALLRVGALLVPVLAPADGMIVAAIPDEGALVGYGDRLFDFLPQD